MGYVFRVDGKEISPAHAMNLRIIANILKAIMRRKEIFTDSLLCELSNAPALEEGYGVRFIDVRIMNIIESTAFSNVLVASCKAIYIRYTSLAKLIIEQ